MLQNPSALRAAFSRHAVRFAGAPLVPDVPGGTDLAHSNQDILNYAAWLDARMHEMDAALGKAPNVNLPVLMGQTGTAQDFVVALQALQQSPNTAAARIVPDWVTFRKQWDAFLVTLPTTQGWTPAARDAALALLTGGISVIYSGANAASGKDTWSQEKTWHGALLEFAAKMRAAGLAPPSIPPLPHAHVDLSTGLQTLNLVLIAASVAGIVFVVSELKR